MQEKFFKNSTNCKFDIIILLSPYVCPFSVEELGIKEAVPSYLDPNLKSEDLKTGVSFASGGCGFDPLTATIVVTLCDNFNKEMNT